MDATSHVLALLIGSLLFSSVLVLPSSDLFEVDVRLLAELWRKERISPADPFKLKHAELLGHLRRSAAANPGLMRVETAGRSVEGREIPLFTIGSGSEKILFWSQMHGDEPTATCALLDLFEFLARHRQEPWVSAILAKYTLLFVPMLNPDGAERNQRRNAQGIDINRDARVLQTPEGRLLKELRDRFEPFLAFNLHNQNSTTTVGESGKVATIALLAVTAEAPKDAAVQAGSMPDARLTKQVVAVLYEALKPFADGHISRYDEAYNPRAFGDNMTRWGTPVVLIESGGQPAGQPPDFTVQLNFVGLLATLNSLASGRVTRADPAVFDALKMNSETPIYDLLLRDAWIFTGIGVPLFRGDVAVRHDARSGAVTDSIIADLGDLGVFSAHATIECHGGLLTPGLIAWDPGKPVLEDAGNDDAYLRKGVTTVLETADLGDPKIRDTSPERIRKQVRKVNWGYVLTGMPRAGSPDGALIAGEWLARGGRAWIVRGDVRAALPEKVSRIPEWFNAELLDPARAARYQVPGSFEGDPSRVLPRWTGEAAVQFRVPGRGLIAAGAAADLVLWTTSDGQPPENLRDFRPKLVILNGRVIDVSKPGPAGSGRFIGR